MNEHSKESKPWFKPPFFIDTESFDKQFVRCAGKWEQCFESKTDALVVAIELNAVFAEDDGS